jgi:hypothetical protein
MNPYNIGDLTDPNLTAPGIKRGIGINGAAAANRYNASAWSTSILDADDYFEFTLTANSGFEINLVSFVYAGQLSSGTANFSLRSSVDGYSNNIGSPNATGASIDLSGPDFQTLACTITFRFYVYGVSASTTTYSINDFIFNGAVTASGAPKLVISNAGTAATGNIELGASAVILSAFTISSNTSQTLSSVTISSGGNATAADINNVRILYDVNGNGIIDALETTSISGAGISLSNDMLFSLSGQTFNCSRRYLIVADVLQTATPGHFVSTSVSTSTSITSTVSNTAGSAMGNLQTIAFSTGTADYFKSNTAAGNWNVAGSWQSSHNGTNWYNATAAPTSGASRIEVLNGHTISITTSGVSMTNTFVKSGAALAISSNDAYTVGGTGTQLTIENGGVLFVNFSSTNIPPILGNGERLVKTGGKVWIGPLLNDGKTIGNAYAHASTSKFTYEDASVFEWANPLVMLSNTADEVYFKTINSTDLPIFRISVTPGYYFGGSGTNVFNCTWEANANCGFAGSGTKTIRGGFRGNATIWQTGGALILPNSSSVLDGNITMNIVSSGLRFTNGAIIPTGANVKITSSPEDQTINKQSGSLLINGALDITDLQIANSSGDVTISGTGKLKTSNIQGFSGTGATIASGTINLVNGSTIELNRLGNQAIQLSPDPFYKNLVLSGSGTKTPSSAFNPVGMVTIKDNVSFDCTGKNVGDGSTGLAMADNSILIVSTTGTQPSMAALPYNLAGGTIKFSGSNSTSENIRSESYYNIEVFGTNVKNSAGNIFIKDQGSFTIKAGGIFEMSDNSIVGLSGSQAFIVESNGIFRCAVQPGFNGPAAFPNSPAVRDNIDILALQPNSTIAYSRSTPNQVSGDQLITNTLPYQNLVISGTGTKTAPPGTLNILGNFQKTGTSFFNHNNGTVLFNGTAGQSFSNSSGFPVLFNNVTNSNTGTGLTINSDSCAIAGELLLSPGSNLNLGSGNIILKSTFNRTANVGTISTALINYPGSGRFIVERFINHVGKWQFLATPTVGQTIAQSWQEGTSFPAGFGTQITSPLYPAGGFDDYTISPSMKSFDNATNTWIGITSTGAPVNNAKGYMLFVRGDRTAALSSTSAAPTILRTAGKIYQPNVTADVPPVTYVPANSYESVGNPYASPVSISNLFTSGFVNLETSIAVWDPSMYGYYGVGGYQTLSSADPKPVPGGTSLYPSGIDFTSIQSGQAFFVKAVAAPGSITFSEGLKSNVSRLTNIASEHIGLEPGITNHFFSAHHSVHRQYFRTSLLTPGGIIADGNSVVFDKKFEDAIDRYDASKLYNSGENFGMLRQGRWLAVEARSPIRKIDTIFYAMYNLRRQEYKLLFAPENMTDLSLSAYLVDNYLGSRTPLSLTDSSFVNITINADAASAKPDRFYVIFVPRKIFTPVPAPKPIVPELSETFPIKGQEADMASISVYPNPVAGLQLQLQLFGLPKGSYGLQVNNHHGQVVYSNTLQIIQVKECKQFKLPSSVAAGQYLLIVTGAGRLSKTMQLVIQ